MVKILSLAAVMIALMMSCSKVKPATVKKAVIKGEWKVTLFEEDGVNETQHFTGYVFNFKDDGTVSATNSSTTMNGTWSVDKESGDDNPKEVHFNLYFNATNHFSEISDDWHIITQEDNKLELEDVSGGDGSIDRLTFEKI